MPVITPRFGANYVPSKNWWYCWMDWDANSIASDLKAIAGLGMDHIRIHCLWPYFQPNAGWVSPTALSRLSELLQIADDHELDVSIAVLDGWLSGFRFFPAWKQDRNMFTNSEMIAAEKLLFSAITDAIGDHPRFLGFDLGNELGVLQYGDHDQVSSREADHWQAEMFTHLAQIAPGKLHVNGVDHNHWFKNFGFTRAGLAEQGALTSIHTWIYFTGALERYGPLGTGTLHLAEYNIELAKAYHVDLSRSVWVQEYGASDEWISLATIPDFAETFTRNALSCSNVWGLTWWSSHDLDPALTEFASLEYGLGLLDIHNQVKPAGARLTELIAHLRADPVQPIARERALILPESIFLQEDRLWAFVDAFMSLIDNGQHPAIIHEKFVDDAEYLAKREIVELIPFEK